MDDSRIETFPAADHGLMPPARHRRISASDPTSAAAPKPNAMVDPSAPADPDTCRICRGEATREEPLFYPCKCSGSIKYVHQDCLMEWLSHSQKKHCELCKTPFRFTKLYSPNMPKALPFHIFISHAAKYLFRNALVWARAFLVLTVWLFWLPYLMRSVWSFLFWISDEGLRAVPDSLFGSMDSVSTRSPTEMVPSAISASECPSSPLFAATTSAATIGRVMSQLPPGAVSQVQRNGMNLLNLSKMEPPSLMRALLLIAYSTPAAVIRERPVSDNASADISRHGAYSLTSIHHPTLLGDVAFLQNMTSSPTVNRTLIAIMEGQVITILVIVCFILIILVRDYVVQQQPEINMRAAFAAAGNAAPAPPQEPPRPPEVVPGGLRDEDVEGLRGPEESSDEEGDYDHEVEVGMELSRTHSQESVRQTFGEAEMPSPNTTLQPTAAPNGDGSHQPWGAFDPQEVRADGARDVLSGIAHDAPALQGAALSYTTPPPSVLGGGPESSTVHEYLRIWREADGDREKILKIVREENLEDKMDYWIKLTKTMMDRNKQPDSVDTAEGPSSGQLYGNQLTADPSRSRGSEGSSEWTWPDDMEAASSESSRQKGKEKATDYVLDRTNYAADGHSLSPPDRSKSRVSTDSPERSHISLATGSASGSWTQSDLQRLPPGESACPSSLEPDPTSTRGELPVWAYTSPPSSTIAESGPPSRHAGTPVSPTAGDEAEPDSSVGGTAAEGAQGLEWGTLPDFNDMPDHLDGGRQPDGLAGLVADFMFRNVDDIDPRELPPLDDDGFGDHDDLFGDAEPEDADALEDVPRDEGIFEAAAAGAIDAEAIEDAEDFEGVLELLGMRGPIAGLFQNAIFLAFLVSITIFFGIFLPYNIGRIAIWTIANPTRPARILFSISKFVQDVALVMLGTTSWVFLSVVDLLGRLLHWRPASGVLATSMVTSRNMSANAALRVIDSLVLDLPPISAGEIRNFSALSHEALMTVKNYVSSSFDMMATALLLVVGGDYSAKAIAVASFAVNTTSAAWHGLNDFPTLLSNPAAWVIDLSTPEVPATVNPELAYWGAMDRTWAILGGYAALCIVAALYLRRGSPFSTGQTGQEWEASIIDGLNQASGVMKVILIIGIEMLVFPLYCGLLLDFALLPLFEDTTVMSRVLFTLNYPLTSIFVHWFVGTGYMFHFALFVSMCRKIMRKGVLYFIRDPDDPEFHPVRDVLERSVTTQLRKILFSAFVYGALVIICLGGVVWGLSYSMPNVLPIHYSSNEPVLEFPIDLLFYNFLMPLAVKFFRPSDGLHAMYTWWFRKCARALRITWFLFGERKVDEEGILVLPPNSPYLKLPWWKRLFLELGKDCIVVPKTWRDTFEGGKAKPTSTIASDDMIRLNLNKILLVQTHQLIPDGRFVRTPASDQVKIPKGKRVFLEVTENNLRLDGKPDTPEADLYSTDQYQFVYVPPNFRARVFLFIMFIWIFAAVTGVGFTIVPLIFGRRMFKLLIPSHIRTNDIYAFSIGIYILGSVAYSIFHIRSMVIKFREWIEATASTFANRDAFHRVAAITTRGAQLLYSYFFLLVAFPLLVSSLMELYVLIPLDTYMYSAYFSPQTVNGGHQNPRHTVRVIQSWTIGLLYMKLGARIVTSWYRETRLAGAIRAVLRRGWFEPDVAILTRAFVIPGLALWLAAIAGPLLSARIFLDHGARGARLDDAALVLIYRLSFPAALVSAIAASMVWSMVGVFKSWRVRIRDEAYLIGERLHNFGVGGGLPRPRGAWRSSGARM